MYSFNIQLLYSSLFLFQVQLKPWTLDTTYKTNRRLGTVGRSRQTGQTSGPQEQLSNEVLSFHSPPIFQAGCWRSHKLKLPEMQTDTSQGPGKVQRPKTATLTALPQPNRNTAAPCPPPPQRPSASLDSLPHQTVVAHPTLHQGGVPEGKLDT